jgi:L-cystine uptake protein TcyP (sodium:dicarboxylate symporter family)
MDRKLTLYILLGMVLGVVVGQALNQLVPAEVIKADIAPWFKLLSDIFLNLIKMLVAPPSSSASRIWATAPRSGASVRARSHGSLLPASCRSALAS